MNAAMVSNVLSLIPERVARVPSGTGFNAHAAACRYPERVAYLSKFLQWLTPLTALTREDQEQLGLLSASGRLLHAVDEEDEGEAEAEPETWEPAQPVL
jgi:hypothetical protein